jgi:hypothetical protein
VEQQQAESGVERVRVTEHSESRRVLRWIFVRGTERLECELALDAEAVFYELTTSRSNQASTPTVERFSVVARALKRQRKSEAALFADGWTFESYELTFAPVPRRPQ